MPRYVAFLRGVMPTNAKMPALKAAFEAAGFSDVKTILGTGNVVFHTALAQEAQIEQLAEQAMTQNLGRNFYPIVRATAALRAMIAANPYANCGMPPEAKRVISFSRQALTPRVALPLAQEQACVFMVSGREAYTAYVPTARGPVFMALIERALGRDVTTRTFDTVVKCAVA